MLWRATVQTEDSSKERGFSPHEQQAQAGDAVFWFNEDPNESHQPVPDTGTWNIPVITPLNPSEQLSLANAGNYPYHCAIHPSETASIVVANAVLIGAGAIPLFGPTTFPQGQCVSWGNSDSEAHQPCPDTGSPWFDAPVNSGDLSKSVSFADAGNIPYKCSLHPDNPAEAGTLNVAHQVTIRSGANPLFGPLTVQQGQYVVWNNTDSQSHQPSPDSGTPWLTSPVGAGTLSPAVQFSTGGTTNYKCAVHPDNPNETGSITVNASS